LLAPGANKRGGVVFQANSGRKGREGLVAQKALQAGFRGKKDWSSERGGGEGSVLH